ncbi:MAG: response regulator [Proteobacteria bacterium]|nr:response regulator [Pseudomonadota bacterium]
MVSDSNTAPLILVVEGNDQHAELIQRSIEEAAEEYRLEIVGTIRAAKMVSERTSPSLVMTDYRLPDGAGSELVAVAAGAWPVILMTSYGNEKVAVEAMKIGAQDYIVKSPEAFDDLHRIVKYALMTWALIVARRQTDEAVLRAKNDWEKTFDAVPDLISIIDLDHTITRVNRAMAARCGLTPQEIVGRKCYEVIDGVSGSHSCCPHSKVAQDGLEHRETFERELLNGVFDVTVSPLFDDGAITGCVHVMRDITKRKQAEEERQNLERQLQHTQKLESLGVLSGGIAHDFNNILTIILGHCYILKENIDTDVDRNVHLQLIESSANRAADLCRQMLTYAGKSTLLQTEFSMWLLVDEIVKMLTSAIKKNVTIILDMKRDIPMIAGDSSQIQQVVMNLIINASEAIGEMAGTITVGLKKRLIQLEKPEIDYFGSKILPGSYACLEVSDTGCGMSDETTRRLFEPFYTTKFTGRGLGMSAILGILKAHNGTLQLSSTQGVGTTFKVYIPITGAYEQGETSLPTKAAVPVLPNATVLLVEDEDTLRNIGTTLLGTLGFSVIDAANGCEALGLYKTYGSEIDLVILDLIMPVMGGIEAYHELRKLNKAVPIILCSGYGAESVEVITAMDDKAGFLHKPYNVIELRRVLSEKLGGKQLCAG